MGFFYMQTSLHIAESLKLLQLKPLNDSCDSSSMQAYIPYIMFCELQCSTCDMTKNCLARKRPDFKNKNMQEGNEFYLKQDYLYYISLSRYFVSKLHLADFNTCIPNVLYVKDLANWVVIL